VTQERIDAFAAATGDPQWIHVDPERAASGPFGATIAHGFLTLSLCVPMLYEVLPPTGRMVVNYGVDRVRCRPPFLPDPCAGSSRCLGRRGRRRGAGDDRGDGGVRAGEKPVCVAELVLPHTPLTGLAPKDMSGTVPPS
jgi:acyl dehydratase